MKIGSKVIVPHVTLLFSETGRKLTLEVATVREHIQTDGWTNPAQDYDYDIRLSNGKRYHTFDVYDIPEGVNPTPEMLAAIANECPPDVLEPSRVTNLRTYVWKALAACKPHPTVASLLADVQGDQRSVTAIVGKDEVNLYRDEACKHPLENLNGKTPQEFLVDLLRALHFNARKGFWHQGKYLVDGVDYHGEEDAVLIQNHGLNGLNFSPSTPPEHR